MKLTADTPPDGDFVRYLAELERASPAYQALRAEGSGAAAPDSGAVPHGRPRVRPVQPEAPARSLAALKNAALLQSPAMRGLALPLLQRLEQALAAAAKKASS